tara:strand:+ start:139 stop:840 length:702 start_codon:yes stop_codon:yes gene_type:complete
VRFSTIFLLVIAVLIACERRDEAHERTCEVNGTSLVEVGTHTFAISSDLRGAYIAGNGPLLGNMSKTERAFSKICPAVDGDVLVVNQLSIFSPARNELTPQHFPEAVSVLISWDEKEGIDLVQTRNWEKFDLTEVGDGFLSTQNGSVGMGSAEMFLQVEVTAETPKGNPVAFSCYYQKTARGRDCFTWWYDREGLYFGYNFFDRDYPREEWLALHSRVLSAVEGLQDERASRG